MMRVLVLFQLALVGCRPPSNARMLPSPQAPAEGTPQWHMFVEHLRDSLQRTDPELEAARAIARGDHHLLGLLSEALEVPGLTKWDEYRPGIYILPATGDAIADAGHAAYIQVASQYAAKYNKAVLALRRSDQ